MKRERTFTVQQIAELVGGTATGDCHRIISGIADLETAEVHDASFFANSRYAQKLAATKAGVVLASAEHVAAGIDFIVVEDPTSAFQKLIELYAELPRHTSDMAGIHPSSCIDPTARIASTAIIGPFVAIGKDVEIGDGSCIHAGCVIAHGVKIGSQCVIYPNVVLREETIVHNRVIIQPGAIIGSCGFGYATDQQGVHTKLKQLGTVVLEDDVEIGAATTIDRARFKATRIGKGTKVDNLVQIAHGVEIGKHCIIVAQTGIAGSTKIGNHVIIGGQVGISGHLEICDGVSIAAKSGVTKSILKPGKYAGHPVMPYSEHQRMQVQLRRISAKKLD